MPIFIKGIIKKLDKEIQDRVQDSCKAIYIFDEEIIGQVTVMNFWSIVNCPGREQSGKSFVEWLQEEILMKNTGIFYWSADYL